MHAVLEAFVEPDIDRLAEGGASTRDLLHLNAKLLNPLNDQAYHVASVAVEDEEWDNMAQGLNDVRCQDLVNQANQLNMRLLRMYSKLSEQ